MSAIKAPKNGVEIRMYRQGHGDCFLLAFRRSAADETPYFVLIDCGLKAGSEAVAGKKLDDVQAEIHEATGGILDLVVITHEHEDHVSGFPDPDDLTHKFRDFQVRRLWLAWTEDETDPVANDLREAFNDKLLTLALASHKLKSLKLDRDQVTRIADFLETETGQRDGEKLLLAARDDLVAAGIAPGRVRQAGLGMAEQAFAEVLGADEKIPGKRYKTRLQGLRRMVTDAGGKIDFLGPEDGPLPLPGADGTPAVEGVRIYPFGPPRDRNLLLSLDPRSDEEFSIGPFALDAPGAGLFAAFTGQIDSVSAASPFAPRYVIPKDSISGRRKKRETSVERYMRETYFDRTQKVRRIDGDWLGEAEALALRLNDEVNNTSLVLGIELVKSGKVLLFTGDAQRGNWISWKGLSWQVETKTVTVKQLLASCVFYKVGHHGSHNATLNGEPTSDHPNLSWMARGAYAEEFTAMIPSNKIWAFAKKPWPWKHPLAAIEDALIEKARSRVMSIKETAALQVSNPERIPRRGRFAAPAFDALWAEFEARTVVDPFYVSHKIADEPPSGSQG